MDLPKPIRVGPYLITFKELTEEVAQREDSPEDALGFFDMDTESIYIAAEVEARPTMFVEVVFHEVQHAINDVYGISEDEGHTEEKRTKQSSRGWAQVVKDNPDFWEWIRLRKMH